MSRPTWTAADIEALAPDAKSVLAVRKLLKEKRFSAVEPTSDGLGWWAKCRGQTGDYEVSARPPSAGSFDTRCTCPSYKQPCKHALALLITLAGSDLPELAAPQLRAGGDFEALLAACFANPDDDLARLVLADYLEERGDDDWAKLIRVQVGMPEPKPHRGRKAVSAEEARLVAAMLEPIPESARDGGRWGSYIPSVSGAFEVRRGFLNYSALTAASVTPSLWPMNFVNAFREGRVESATFTATARDLTAEAAELLRLVGTVRLIAAPATDRALRSFATELAPGVPGSRVQRVEVPESRRERWAELLSDPQGVEANFDGSAVELRDPPLASLRRQVAGRAFRGIDTVTIRDRLTAEVAGVLTDDSDLMTAATRWQFRDLALTVAAAAALGPAGPARATIQMLNVGWQAVGAVAAWLDSNWLRQAESIDITSPDVNVAVDAFTVGHYPNLKTLLLSSRTTYGGTALRLLTSGAFPQLDVLASAGEQFLHAEALELRLDPDTHSVGLLILGGQGFRLERVGAGLRLGVDGDMDRGWPPAARSLDWSGVTEVSIQSADVPPEWFAVLAACFPNGLDSLALDHCGLRVAHAKALAAVLPTLKPRLLSLAQNAIGPVSLRALAGSLDSVTELDLSGNGLTEKAREMLPDSCAVRL